MGDPAYQEFNNASIPTETREDGVTLKVIAGSTASGIVGAVRNRPTEAMYFDVGIPAGESLLEPVPETHGAFVFVVEGSASIEQHVLDAGTLAILGDGDSVRIEAPERSSRLLLVAARPLNEPIARGGPFVMNTQQELRQAFHDYQTGRF
jgi:redox-sensitive bicupin YhaK (pirin superfamily)